MDQVMKKYDIDLLIDLRHVLLENPYSNIKKIFADSFVKVANQQ